MNWLPNFFIAGAPKSGTSSVHQWIADHPDACGSRDKETYFFVDPGTHMYQPAAHISAGLETWRDQFPLSDEAQPKVIVESTPGYLYYQTAQTHIPAMASKPKCLFILREPAAQIHSLYTYFRNNWDWIPADMSFEAFLAAARTKSHGFKGNELARDAFENAAYVRHLRVWHARLGQDRMMVRGFDDLVSDPQRFVQEVAIWLGLDPAFYSTYDFPRENATYAPRNRRLQKLNLALRNKLPKGAAYNAVRGLYRRLNTSTGKAALSDRDALLLEELRLEFAQDNRDLAQEFGVQFHAPAAV